ncbi:MAG TPA: glycosyltransferase [Acetobacteraceae bacterium]|nr:glycosyltransferase [Acetobacteraceae bacterium]
MTPARPLTLLSVFSTFAVGGPQVRFAALANHFGRRYRHLVVAMDGATAARERLDAGLDIDFLPVAPRQGKTFGNLPPFYRMLRALRPDMLVTYNWGAIDWALTNLAAGIRHVHIEDGFGPEEAERQLPRRALIRRLTLRRSMVVLPSRTLERIALDDWRLPHARLRYVPNGIDLERLGTPGSGWRERFAGEGPVVGTVAALRPEKALDRLLRAFAALPGPAGLVIAGNGPARPGLERLAAELGVAERVYFPGHVSELGALYSAFDIFALSSDTEQMPLSVIEAMAAGLPVAATDVGDVRLMVAPENAGFIGPRDDGALARSLGRLIGDAELRTRLGAANRAKAAAEYDERVMFATYGALFDGAELTLPASRLLSACAA